MGPSAAFDQSNLSSHLPHATLVFLQLHQVTLCRCVLRGQVLMNPRLQSRPEQVPPAVASEQGWAVLGVVNLLVLGLRTAVLLDDGSVFLHRHQLTLGQPRSRT